MIANPQVLLHFNSRNAPVILENDIHYRPDYTLSLLLYGELTKRCKTFFFLQNIFFMILLRKKNTTSACELEAQNRLSVAAVIIHF